MRPGLPIDPKTVFAGKRVCIRPIEVCDTQMLLSWRNSDYVIKNFFYRNPLSEAEHLNWLEKKVNKGLVYQFIVCLNETGEPVGCVYFQGYDPENNSMESGLFMSPDTLRGKGLAGEAYGLMLFDFGRDCLGLSRAYARILQENKASIRVHEKLGFKRIEEQEIPIVPTGEPAKSYLMVCDLNN